MSENQAPKGDGSAAAAWARQHNAGETAQDRADWRDGIRILLEGGPYHGRATSRAACDTLEPYQRGYAPEELELVVDDDTINFEPSDWGVGNIAVYRWNHRTSVHTYRFDSLLVPSSSCRLVACRFEGGPWDNELGLANEAAPQWIPSPEEEAQLNGAKYFIHGNDFHYQVGAYAGMHTYGCYVDCRPVDGPHKGKTLSQAVNKDDFQARGAPRSIKSCDNSIYAYYSYGWVRRGSLGVHEYHNTGGLRGDPD